LSADHVVTRPTQKILGLEWPRETTAAERNSLLAGGAGWMLDSFDVALYALVLSSLMRDIGIGTAAGGLLASLTLAASAVGGVIFGFVADRIGRVRSLSTSILIYSLATAGCGFAHTVIALAILRVILGLGMGGEWTAGAALVAETWPAEHRGKALGLMQSTWAIGGMLAAGVAWAILPRWGWRGAFFVGVLPALVAFWVQRRVPEPEIWKGREQATGESSCVPLRVLWREDIRWNGLLATAMNTFSMLGYWGLFTWIPTYFSLPVSQGGRGLSVATTYGWLLVIGVGQWLGYVLFGFAADGFGRRRTYFAYLFVAAILTPIYGVIRNPLWLLALGPLLAFFGTGFFSGFGAIASELFPTEIRATAMGLSYNVGRGISAVAPLAVGALAMRIGLGHAFFMLGGAFFIAALLTLALPETKGKKLE
jgi:MFS family permease